jgi:threonyl-tRNA synthetase
MKILQTHSDWIEYEPIEKEIEQAEKTEKKVYKFENILVVFTAIEEDDNEEVGKKAIEEIKEFLEKIKLNKILIYPFVHLTNNPAKPENALKILKFMENYAKKLKIETYRAPFGWNKRITNAVKGHPLAEQSKTFAPAETKKEKVPEALKAEEKLKSYWFILEPNGKLIPVEKFDFSNFENLKKFADYEIAKSRAVQQIPPHAILMRKLEIADFEPGSDPGNLRFYPKGRLIKSLIEEFVTQKVLEYGAIEVETPVMYDFLHPSLANYLNRFPARQYVVKSEDKDFFLRFSACFGQFLILKDAQISYKQLPFKIYELAKSYRREKSGELVALRRLRAFTMPDVHVICANLEQAKKESIKRFKLSLNVLKGLGLNKKDFELAIRFTKDFYKKNKKFIVSLVKLIGKPALVEMWDERFFYFVLKWEFNFVDNLNKASALSTDQIDVENAERYGITYIDEKGKKQYPIILHCSPSGAIERCIYALLEKAYADQQNKKVPSLPLWLSPTQVRVIPLSDKYLRISEKIAKEIEKNKIRVDIDDRRETVEKKIRDAELEWVPFIVVVGKKEVKSKKISVRIRESGKIKEMKVEKLVELVKSLTKDKPFKPLSLPKLLSNRPIFVG